MDKHRPATKVAEELLTAPAGATMAELIRATGGPQYNVLSKLDARGFTIRKVREGRSTRYFAVPPATMAFETTVTSQGQVTIPKHIRERLNVRAGGKLRLVLESDDRVVMTPADLSVRRLFGILGKPPRRATIAEMGEAASRGAVKRYLRSKR